MVKGSLIFPFQTQSSALRLAKFANLLIIVGVPVPLRLSYSLNLNRWQGHYHYPNVRRYLPLGLLSAV